MTKRKEEEREGEQMEKRKTGGIEGEVGERRRRILYSCSICCANFSVILVRTTVELMESPPPFFTCRTQRASGHTTTGKMGPLLQLLYSLAIQAPTTLCSFSGYANMGTSLCTVYHLPFLHFLHYQLQKVSQVKFSQQTSMSCTHKT